MSSTLSQMQLYNFLYEPYGTQQSSGRSPTIQTELSRFESHPNHCVATMNRMFTPPHSSHPRVAWNQCAPSLWQKTRHHHHNSCPDYLPLFLLWTHICPWSSKAAKSFVFKFQTTIDWSWLAEKSRRRFLSKVIHWTDAAIKQQSRLKFWKRD